MDTLYIKNMVCDRCKTAVEKVLTEAGLPPQSVELGEVDIDRKPTPEQLLRIRRQLEALGFELLDDRRQRTIEQIKSVIIRLVHYSNGHATLNLSDHIASELHQDYSALSKLFSEVTGMTIERFYIAQRIERVKELIRYNERSLTQIALQMDYSSVAHLSAQFKSVTGMTPSAFKALKQNTRLPLDKV